MKMRTDVAQQMRHEIEGSGAYVPTIFDILTVGTKTIRDPVNPHDAGWEVSSAAMARDKGLKVDEVRTVPKRGTFALDLRGMLQEDAVSEAVEKRLSSPLFWTPLSALRVSPRASPG